MADHVYKIQHFDSDWGWVHSTMAGPSLYDAYAMLRGYKRDYPRDKYRLVEFEPSSGKIIAVLPDKPEAT